MEKARLQREIRERERGRDTQTRHTRRTRRERGEKGKREKERKEKRRKDTRAQEMEQRPTCDAGWGREPSGMHRMHPAHLLAGFSSDWDDSNRVCERGVYLRVGDANTPQERRVGREKLEKKDRRTNNRGGCGRPREGDELDRQEIQEKLQQLFVPRR